ncbi:MAG: hypothetical protein SA378_11590 [Sedimentibacter sp.]|uniref:hypothetical protein n=1 Tax=Sedimentibacter sp. TaxID=1960295 RepID=UPI0029820BDF|nr:hypothetical protein [Sedimentibacter sp.]MDW5300758.1 hypothetical protein [Sedimentibacter sp.]
MIMFENKQEEEMLNYYMHRYTVSVLADSIQSYPEYRRSVLEKSTVVEVDEDEVMEFASQYIEERGD